MIVIDSILSLFLSNGRAKQKNGRETGGISFIHPVPNPLSAKAFRAKTGGREGHFEKCHFPEEADTGNRQNAHYLLALSQPNANAESEAFGLAVRR
jgi:hypothetical protein